MALLTAIVEIIFVVGVSNLVFEIRMAKWLKNK